jgi:hypothetical protein
MHGTTGGRKRQARCYCSTRRKKHGCDQPLTAAGPIEEQIARFLAEFQPSEAMREEILDRLAHDENTDTEDIGRKRRQLTECRKRLRDLYELGDLDRSEYVSKRDSLDAELDALAPGPAPDLDHPQAVLEDFGRFWKEETDPEPRRELLQQLFELVWVDGQKIVAVRPTPAFADLFTSVAASKQRGVKSGSDGTRTKALRTGGSRSGSEPPPDAAVNRQLLVGK